MFTSYYPSPLGVLRISATESYVTEIHFCSDTEIPGDSEDTSFTPLLQLCTEQLIEYFQGSRRVFDLPVYQAGTSFQELVWSALMPIAFGKTITYKELAIKLGDLKSIRAAASAVGKNNLAIIVPCHRVIGSNRELVGYAGGIWRKKWLLQHEQKIALGVQTLF